MVVPPELGSFLIEAIISGALIAGLGLAGASFYKSRIQNQDYLDKLQELNSFHSTLTKLLQNSSNCNATFKQWADSSQVPGTAGTDLKMIYLCTSNCREEIIANGVNRGTPLLTEATANPTNNTNWLPINITNLTNRQRHWQIRDIGMIPLTKTGKGIINFMYELHPGRPDARIVKKSITVNMKFNLANTKFISCGSDTESSVRSAMQEMCEALSSGIAGAGEQKLVEWKDDQLKCLMRSGSPCPYGQSQVGVDTKGSYKCVSLTGNVQGDELFNGDDNNCSGNLRPTVQIGSDGQLRISCI